MFDKPRTFATAESVKVGDVLVEALHTDEVAYIVTKRTAKTLWLAAIYDKPGRGHIDERCDRGRSGLAVVWRIVDTDSAGHERVARFNKEGRIKLARHAGATPLRHAAEINGQPVRRYDERW